MLELLLLTLPMHGSCLLLMSIITVKATGTTVMREVLLHHGWVWHVHRLPKDKGEELG